MRIGVSFALSVLLPGEPAYACRFTSELTAEQLSRADTVFVGRIVRLVAGNGSGKSAVDLVSTVTLEVDHVVRGRQVAGTIDVYGYDSISTQFPPSEEQFVARLGPVVEVGIVFPDTIKSKTGCHYRDRTKGAAKMGARVNCRIDLPVTIPFRNNTDIPLEHPTIIGDFCTNPYIHAVGQGFSWPSYPFEPKQRRHPLETEQ